MSASDKRDNRRVVRVRDTLLPSVNPIHHDKLEALRGFVNEVLTGPARDHIARIVLFGSTAAGSPRWDSDVDLLVLATRDLEEVREACRRAEASVPAPHSIEPIVEPMSHILVPDSYFVREVLRNGKEVYSMSRDELTRQAVENIYWLAREYLAGAEDNLTDHPRLAVDAAYNAAGLCAKAFLLLDGVERLPTRHGATIRLFSDRFLKTERLPSRLGREVNRALDERNRARYQFEVDITHDTAQKVVSLARELLEHLQEHLTVEAQETSAQTA